MLFSNIYYKCPEKGDHTILMPRNRLIKSLKWFLPNTNIHRRVSALSQNFCFFKGHNCGLVGYLMLKRVPTWNVHLTLNSVPQAAMNYGHISSTIFCHMRAIIRWLGWRSKICGFVLFHLDDLQLSSLISSYWDDISCKKWRVTGIIGFT